METILLLSQSRSSSLFQVVGGRSRAVDRILLRLDSIAREGAAHMYYSVQQRLHTESQCVIGRDPCNVAAWEEAGREPSVKKDYPK